MKSAAVHGPGMVDSRIWHFSKNGIYMVKSGYRIAMEFLEQNPEPVAGDWRKLWALHVPPKVKNFQWRACRECLPTRLNLQRKGIGTTSLCAMCNIDLENNWHVFILSICKIVLGDGGFV